MVAPPCNPTATNLAREAAVVRVSVLRKANGVAKVLAVWVFDAGVLRETFILESLQRLALGRRNRGEWVAR